MTYVERKVITEDDFPVWVKLTPAILNTIKEDSDDSLPWIFCSKNLVKGANHYLSINYRNRELFSFAYREDSDDIACFEKSKPGKVIIVHNAEDPGYEVGPEFVDFESWYNYALKVENGDHSYENIPGIDFNPYDE